MSRNNLYAAVDMGATKTIVLVGDNVRGRLNLLGYGEAPSGGGVQRGIVVDSGAALESLRNAFAEAEKSAGAAYEVRRSYFAVSGPHVIGRIETGLASVAAGRVTEDELRYAAEDAHRILCPPPRCLLRHEAQDWRVDARSMPDRGLGREGRKFEIEFWRTEADMNEIRRFAVMAANIGAPVERFIPAPHASAIIATTTQERRNGVLVVDLGAALTDVILYLDNRILLAESLPFGGDDLTNELSRNLRMRPGDAEALKRTMGRARLEPEHKGSRLLFTPGEGVIGGRQLRAEEVHGSLEKRLRETFEGLRERIQSVLPVGRGVTHCVLTGGSCALTGLDALVAEILGMRCERLCDREWTESFNEPRHSTARGLFELALDEELHAVAQADESASRHTPGLVRLLWDTSGLGRLFG